MAESISSHGGQQQQQHLIPVKLNQEYRVKLGRTFTFPKENAFHTIKYDFKPKSVDSTKPGRMRVSGDEVSVSLPVTQAESADDAALFKGAKRTCTKECVLIINTATGEAILEKISNTVQLKGVRDPKKKKQPRSVSPILSQVKTLKVPTTKQGEGSNPSSSSKKKRVKKSSPPLPATIIPPPSSAPPPKPPQPVISSKPPPSSSSSSSSLLAMAPLPDSISPLRSNNPTPEPPSLFVSQPSKRKKDVPSSRSSSSSSSSDSSSSSGSDSETEFIAIPSTSVSQPSLSSMPQFITSSTIQQPLPMSVGGSMPLGFQTLPQHHVMGGMNPPGAVVLGDAGNNGLSQMGGSLSDTSSSSSSNGEDDSSSSDSEKNEMHHQQQPVINSTGVDIRQRSMSVLKRDLEMSESDSD